MPGEAEDEIDLMEHSEDGAHAEPVAGDTAAIEAEAVRNGWVPKEQFRGRPNDWVDAPEFLRRGTEILPIVQRQLRDQKTENRRIQSELTELRNKTDEQTSTIQELLTIARGAEQRGRQNAIRELEARQREAATTGDVATFDETKSALDELRAAPTPPPTPKPVSRAPAPGAVAPEVAQFVEDNPWFSANPVLNAAMQREHVRLTTVEPDLALADNLEKAKRIIQARFPQEFGFDPPQTPEPVVPQPRPQRRNSVAPPSPPARDPQGVDPLKISSIQDPDERAQARGAFERQRRAIGEDFSEADYMRLYNDPHLEGHDFRTKKVK